jgi:hypothetical protein
MFYVVSWDIDIDAESAVEAAREAKRIQADPKSGANVFDVREFTDTTDETLEIIDLDLEG